jgi:hypothetical protein
MAFDANHIAIYKFENNVLDSSGNGHTLNTAGGSALFDSNIKHDDSYSVHYTNSGFYNTFPQSLESALIGSSYTIEMWLYKDGTTGDHQFTYNDQGGATQWACGWVTASNVLNVNWGNYTGGTAIAIPFNFTNLKEKWLGLAFTYNYATDTLKIYTTFADQSTWQLHGTYTTAGNPWNSTNGTRYFGVGANWPTAYFDNLVFSNVVRTSFPSYAGTLPSGAKTIGTFNMPKSRFKKQRLGAI